MNTNFSGGFNFYNFQDDDYHYEELEAETNTFYSTYRDYYNNRKSDEDITEVVTQPFWQSMRLSKKRLDSNGLTVDVQITNNKLDHYKDKETVRDGRNYIGNIRRRIQIEKCIYKNNKLIFNKNEKKLGILNTIKAQGEGDYAMCPNCGNMGKISSYINGCDYCNSKFSVNEFREKVSSFAVEEDTDSKTKAMFKKIICSLLVIMAFMVVVLISSLVYTIYTDMSSSSLTAGTNSAIVFIVLLGVVPIFFIIFILSFFVFAVILGMLYKRISYRVEHNSLYSELNSKIDNFSSENFAQNLEYKLRNIHFADSGKDVKAFSSIDLSDIVESYSKVIECNLVKLKFIQINELSDRYEVFLKASLNNTTIKGERVKEESENVYLLMTGLKSVEEKSISTIKHYSCKSCGGSINLLEGGYCEYCGTQIDYAQYSWIINRYYSNVSEGKAYGLKENSYCGHKRVMGAYTKIKWKLIGIYIGLFTIFTAILCVSNQDIVYQLIHKDEYFSYANEQFDNTREFDRVVDDVELVNCEEGYVDRMYTYKCDDAKVKADEYAQYLVDKGYRILSSESDKIKLTKYVKFTDKIFGYHTIKISIKGNKVVVYEDLSDEDD